MREIIDTEIDEIGEVEEIATYWNNIGYGDFEYVFETIYRTKKGDYFFHGEGGEFTKYSEEIIEELSSEEVFEWLKEHNKIEIIEEMFSDKIEEA